MADSATTGAGGTGAGTPKVKRAKKGSDVGGDSDQGADFSESDSAAATAGGTAEDGDEDEDEESDEKTASVNASGGGGRRSVGRRPTGLRKAQSSIMTKSYFVENSEPLVSNLGPISFEATPREFSTGSCGWFYGAKQELTVGEKKVVCQLTVNCTGRTE